MKIEITNNFSSKLKRQISYISKDKPEAARKFNKLILEKIKHLSKMPYQNRKSIFFDDDNTRDLIIKGYLIVYEIIPNENRIVVFAFHKW